MHARPLSFALAFVLALAAACFVGSASAQPIPGYYQCEFRLYNSSFVTQRRYLNFPEISYSPLDDLFTLLDSSFDANLQVAFAKYNLLNFTLPVEGFTRVQWADIIPGNRSFTIANGSWVSMETVVNLYSEVPCAERQFDIERAMVNATIVTANQKLLGVPGGLRGVSNLIGAQLSVRTLSEPWGPSPSPSPSPFPSPVNETDLCWLSGSGSFSVLSSNFPSFSWDVTGILERLVNVLDLTYYTDFSAGYSPYSSNTTGFSFHLRVLESESVNVTSKTIFAVSQALEYATGGPFDEGAKLNIQVSRSCWVPPPVYVRRCAQVSAKLESGEPFISTNASYDFTSLFVNKLWGLGLVSYVEYTEVQSMVWTPFDLPDTVQLALRTVYSIDEDRLDKIDAGIGYALTSALREQIQVQADAPLFEVAYTITPCHTPF